jgi:hypothetical protein
MPPSQSPLKGTPASARQALRPSTSERVRAPSASKKPGF